VWRREEQEARRSIYTPDVGTQHHRQYQQCFRYMSHDTERPKQKESEKHMYISFRNFGSSKATNHLPHTNFRTRFVEIINCHGDDFEDIISFNASPQST
jgi:hypothetical protein